MPGLRVSKIQIIIKHVLLWSFTYLEYKVFLRSIIKWSLILAEIFAKGKMASNKLFAVDAGHCTSVSMSSIMQLWFSSTTNGSFLVKLYKQSGI